MFFLARPTESIVAKSDRRTGFCQLMAHSHNKIHGIEQCILETLANLL